MNKEEILKKQKGIDFFECFTGYELEQIYAAMEEAYAQSSQQQGEGINIQMYKALVALKEHVQYHGVPLGSGISQQISDAIASATPAASGNGEGVANLKEFLTQREFLKSVLSIAQRKGENTYWEGVIKQCRNLLSTTNPAADH